MSTGQTSQYLLNQALFYQIMGDIDRFWRDWKRLTAIEKKAISGLEKSLSFVFRYIPKKKIYAIYVKGSFVSRELNKKSDVDLVVILTDRNYGVKLQELHKIHSSSYHPVDILPLSLWEFKHNTRYVKHSGPKEKPRGFLFWIDRAKLICGKAMPKNKYTLSPLRRRFKGYLDAFDTAFFPCYEKKIIAFSSMLKQVMWIGINEQLLKYKKMTYSYKEIAECYPKNHLVHQAYLLRGKKVSDAEKRDFIAKSKRYVKRVKDDL
jgi:predicted nucleotidyltransferase